MLFIPQSGWFLNKALTSKKQLLKWKEKECFLGFWVWHSLHFVLIYLSIYFEDVRFLFSTKLARAEHCNRYFSSDISTMSFNYQKQPLSFSYSLSRAYAFALLSATLLCCVLYHCCPQGRHLSWMVKVYLFFKPSSNGTSWIRPSVPLGNPFFPKQNSSFPAPSPHPENYRHFDTVHTHMCGHQMVKEKNFSSAGERSSEVPLLPLGEWKCSTGSNHEGNDSKEVEKRGDSFSR